MAAPLTGVTSASQIAQQKTQDHASQAKQGASKFDSVMQTKQTQGVQNASQVQQVQAAQSAQKVSQTKTVEQATKTERLQLNKNAAQSPVHAKTETSKLQQTIGQVFGDMEKGQV